MGGFDSCAAEVAELDEGLEGRGGCGLRGWGAEWGWDVQECEGVVDFGAEEVGEVFLGWGEG